MLRHSSTNLIYRIIVASCVSITIVNFLHVYISNLLHRFDPWALLSGLRRKATSLGAEYVRGNICGLSKRDQVDGAPAALTSAEVWRGRGRTYRLSYATRSTTRSLVLSRTNFYMHFTRMHIFIIRKLFSIWRAYLNFSSERRNGIIFIGFMWCLLISLQDEQSWCYYVEIKV